MFKTISHNNSEICADCSQINPIWASINHGTLICDQCAIIHRSLGNFISLIKPLKSNWKLTQLQMVLDLYRSGSNSIWEHTLLDPHILSSVSAANLPKGLSSHSYPRKKPQPNDPLHPNKNDFIRAKYQMFAYVNKAHGIKDDVESESDISEQLHSSVRTPNLKTSLRLLVAGANPNYIHSEKFNSPLHMAAKSGQMSQIELLLIYGANLTIVDSRNKSAIDYAIEAGHDEIAYRLIEHQFDLSDKLTRFICQGRQPNHRNGEHFLIVDIKADFLNYMDNSSSENEKKRNSTESFRNELHQSLRSLSHKSFKELTRDVYDELDRREINSFVGVQYCNDNGKLSIMHQQLVIPFLPVYQYFSTTRNQGRQKLALLSTKEITLLIIDVLNEIRRRVYNINGHCLYKDDKHNKVYEFEDEDSEPLYDSVPSEEDYDECNELIDDKNNSIPPINNKTQPQAILKKNKVTIAKEKPKNVSAKFDNENFVSMTEYSALKEQMFKSTDMMEAFLNENKLMRQEISRLQTVVEKLVDENIQLKQMIIPTNTVTPVKSTVCKSNSLLIESTEQLISNSSSNNNNNNNNSYGRNIRPQSLMNHVTNNGSSNSFTKEIFSLKSPTNLTVPSSSPTKSLNYFNVQSSNQRNASSQYNLPYNTTESTFANTPNSSSSSISSQIVTNLSNLPNASAYQTGSIFTNEISNHQRQQNCSMASSVVANSNVVQKNSLPTKDEVIKKIEFITNGIKDLLFKARHGKHDEFQQCSVRICNYVSDMINLFPESIESASNIDNVIQLNQALNVLQTNVLELYDECHSYDNLSRNQHALSNNYSSVIDKAAELASSVKSIINIYTMQTNSNSNNNNTNTNTNHNHPHHSNVNIIPDRLS